MINSKTLVLFKFFTSLLLCFSLSGMFAQDSTENTRKIEELDQKLQQINRQIGPYYLRDIEDLSDQNRLELNSVRETLNTTNESLREEISDRRRNADQIEEIEDDLEKRMKEMGTIEQELDTRQGKVKQTPGRSPRPSLRQQCGTEYTSVVSRLGFPPSDVL